MNGLLRRQDRTLLRGNRIPQLSTAVYCAWAGALTLASLAVAALFRPSLAYAIADAVWPTRPFDPVPRTFYEERVAPVLANRCVGCHGARRPKADLRLDNLAFVLRGGKHGKVIRPGSIAESELVNRISLPSTDRKVMPPAGRPRLTDDEAQIIRLWIAAGASRIQPVEAIQNAPVLAKVVELPRMDTVAVARERAPLAEIVKELQVQFPNVIAYESGGSADLEINASLMGPTFGDRQLTMLEPLYGRVVRADFSRSAVSHASARSIARMERLRVLRLMNTSVTDTTIEALRGLQQLEVLTVIGTSVTARSLAPFRARGIRVYKEPDDYPTI